MAYTQAQLVAAYTAANNGVAPDAATTATLGAIAAQTLTGQQTDAAALAFVINSAQDDVQVAVQAYQFFTGKTPSKAGLDFLTNSATNTTDLNDPYYAQFNLENRYINFAANLGINGEGAAAFSTAYGSMNFATFVGVVYEQIIGSSYATAAKISVPAAIADIVSRQAAFVQTARDRGIINATSTAAQIDLATKAAVVGYLMAEGVKADVGIYAAGANNFVNALIAGTAVHNVNLLTTYSTLGGGIGSPIAGLGSTGTGLLTVNPETLTANIFNAPQAYTPGGDDLVNTLQNDDFLTGIGADPTLNVTLGNPNDNGVALITPSLRGVEVINARFDATSANMVLDLQDTTGTAVNTGVDTINITRIAAGATATVQNIAESIATNLSVANSQATSGAVNFTYLSAALAGTADKGSVALSNVDVGTLRIEENSAIPTEGFETLTVNSVGSANKVGTLQAEDVQTLNITGDKNLTLGSTTNVATGAAGFLGTTLNTEATRYGNGLANMAGSLSKIDASTFKGNLDITIGTEFQAGKDDTSGQNVQLSVIGGDGNDTFRLTGSVVAGATGNVDTINGGAGNNTVVITGGSTIAAAGTAAAPVANVTNIQALQVRSGHDVGTGADTITVNADAFDKLATIYVRNEGQDQPGGAGTPWLAAGEGLTVNLNNLQSAQINGITVAHGTTGNSSIGNNVINATLKTATGGADTATVTIVDGINTDPVFSFAFTTLGVEKVAIVDSDTESNSVLINQGGFATAATSTVSALAGSSITLTGGAAGKYMNFDTDGTTRVAQSLSGYGYATNGSATNSTTATAAIAAIANVPTATSTSARDNTVSTVLYGAGLVAADGVKFVGESLAAGAYLGDVTIRLGDVTRADGVSSQSLVTGVGNDTFIFDATGTTNAGFTSGDTISAGTGTDTLVLDGDTAGAVGPRIDVQTSEWDNLKGIDVLRFANNANVANGTGFVNGVVPNTGGAYYVAIDNDFVSQTDSGNRLTIVNNDGRLDVSTESDVVVDLRGLSQTKFVTFVGANGVGGTHASARIIVDDISANSSMILNGGDSDVRTGVGAIGNNNVYEVRNTANVSINDLSQTSNFGVIEFTNDQAVAQTLTLTLNNTIVEQLVDTSQTATSALTAETLTIRAIDNGAVASNLNVNASAVTGFHYVNIIGSVVGTNTIVGGAGNDVITGGNLADTLTGGEGTDSLTGGAGNDSISGGDGNDTIVGGTGVDTMDGGAGNDRFVFSDVDADIDTLAGAVTDVISAGFVSGGDVLDFTTAGSGTNYAEVLVAAANLAALLTAADTALDGTIKYYFGVTGGNGYLVWDDDGTGYTSVVQLTGVTDMAAADIV